VLFKGRVIFKQYVPKEHKRFGIKIYKLCNMNGYTYDMSVYLGKDGQNATQMITAHVRVKSLAMRAGGVGHNYYMGNCFLSSVLFDNLHKRAINCCRTVRIIKECWGTLTIRY
jgi:hypothetical protein